jgi:hypothetical protein
MVAVQMRAHDKVDVVDGDAGTYQRRSWPLVE